MLNGSGTRHVSNHYGDGGGILLVGVSASMECCIIKDNFAINGGGIYQNISTLYLYKTKIYNNHAYENGGGIFYGGNEIIFDSINRCDLYLNTSPRGTDFSQHNSSPVPLIFLDTATIIEPDHYYFNCMDSYGFQDCSFNFSIEHAKIQEALTDVYVNPLGNDSNSGLTPDDPLKTISFAILKIRSDSLLNHAIYLSSGLYSKENGNKFPIAIKSNVPIIGEKAENTQIDLDSIITFGKVNPGDKVIELKNLTILNGMGDSLNTSFSTLTIAFAQHVILKNLIFKSCSGKNISSVITAYGCDSLFICNTSVLENSTATCIHIYGSYFDTPCYSELDHCTIKNNYPGPFQHYDNYGKGISIENLMGNESYMTSKLINCQITDNFDGTSDPNYPATSGVAFSYNTIANVINTTIGNNTSTNPVSGAVGICQHSEVSFYNSVIYGNNVNQIIMYITEPDMGCNLQLYHSVIENGENGIYNISPYSTYYYDSTNIEDDPRWIGSGDYPYALLNDSPCINSGTQDLPEGIILPDTDLMGGPRISGGEIDRGAYEYLFVGTDEHLYPETSEYFQIYPNPFTDELSISFDSPLYGKNVNLELYDINGIFIRSIFDGTVEATPIIWMPGKQDAQIKPGVYYLRMTTESALIDTVKVIKI